MNRELLLKSVEVFGLVLTETQLNAFAILSSELVRWNKQINLTAIHGQDEITVKHLVDSLSLVPLLEQGIRLLDIGSGGGFPALPLAIVRPDLRITSIDAVNKKISFQRHICRLLKISSVEALHGRVENMEDKHSAAYDVVTSRAFSNLPLFLALAEPFLCKHGKAISMRGSGGVLEAQAAAEEIVATGFIIESPLRYCLPLNMGERCLLTARKLR